MCFQFFWVDNLQVELLLDHMAAMSTFLRDLKTLFSIFILKDCMRDLGERNREEREERPGGEEDRDVLGGGASGSCRGCSARSIRSQADCCHGTDPS